MATRTLAARTLMAGMVFACSGGVSTVKAEGWSLPNPFRRADQRNVSVDRARAGTSDQRGWLPFGNAWGRSAAPKAAAPPRANPNPLQQLNRGAKSLLTKTRDTITSPFQRNRAENPQVTRRSEAPRSSFFDGWGKKPAPAAPPVNSVGDFLKQPRVQP